MAGWTSKCHCYSWRPVTAIAGAEGSREALSVVVVSAIELSVGPRSKVTAVPSKVARYSIHSVVGLPVKRSSEPNAPFFVMRVPRAEGKDDSVNNR